MSRDSYIFPPFNLDPLILLDDDLADRLYGRVRKITESSDGDRRVWVFLMRNMYRIAVKEKSLNDGEKKPDKESKEDIRKIAAVTLRGWAKAFNFAVKSQVDGGHFLKPNRIDTDSPRETWRPPLSYSGGGEAGKKWLRYNVDGVVTDEILRKMEIYRLAVKRFYLADESLQLG